MNVGRFARHYLEMVVAMAVGMAVYGALFRSPLDPTGYGAVLRLHPYVSECLMLVAMSIPMVAFMRWRRHAWTRTAEMVAAMVLPAVVVVCAVASSSVPFLTEDTLGAWSHTAMLAGMFLAMLYRRAEYAHAHAHPRAVGPAAASDPSL